MSKYIIDFNQIIKESIASVGGKGSNLGLLFQIADISVPDGFCITTKAYKQIVKTNDSLGILVNQLAALKIHEKSEIQGFGKKIRSLIENIEVPEEIASEISKGIERIGKTAGYAIRSSATAEDLPNASFAGQHDSYLNIKGTDSILKHVRKCWASLFTDRAITYRIQNSFDHNKVYLSVVVQKMVQPQVSGIMFTADPVTSNKKLVKIDAGFGLGEALVSGIVTADNYTVKAGKIVEKIIASKKLAIFANEQEGTEKCTVERAQSDKQALTDTQILNLAAIGRKLESHFGCPQDIEWCLQNGTFYFVQSRPITTLFPIPESTDGKNRAYLSAGHLQMMTDPIKPLGIFFFNIAMGDNTYIESAGRLYQDMSNDLASFIGRKLALFLLKTLGEELMLKSVKRLVKQKEIIKSLPHGRQRVFSRKEGEVSLAFLPHKIRMTRENNPDNVKDVIKKDQRVIDKLREDIIKLKGEQLFAFIEHEQRVLKRTIVTPECTGVLTTGLLPINWINKKAKKWLGIQTAADTFTQCVPNSITSDMGLDLMDVSDAVRKYPEVIAYLKSRAEDDSFFQNLMLLEGGTQVCRVMKAYLKKYGMRCSGDIDITRLRWSEQPTALIPTILSNIKNFEANSKETKFNQGIKQSKDKERELLEQIKSLPGGKNKARKMTKKISVMRNHIGFREYPKHAFVERYYIFKKALLKEADLLVKKSILKNREDIYYLYFDEMRSIVNGKSFDYKIIEKRKDAYKAYAKLTPPRVMTTDEGIITSTYDEKNSSKNALPGLAVSAGVVEGRARVVASMEDADIKEGDILVTRFTDPSWTPVFVSIKGLVTEVGGLVTHGAIIAREYGLPAVVSVENATTLIKDGDIIRVDGTEGYVEVLDK